MKKNFWLWIAIALLMLILVTELFEVKHSTPNAKDNAGNIICAEYLFLTLPCFIEWFLGNSFFRKFWIAGTFLFGFAGAIAVLNTDNGAKNVLEFLILIFLFGILRFYWWKSLTTQTNLLLQKIPLLLKKKIENETN